MKDILESDCDCGCWDFQRLKDERDRFKRLYEQRGTDAADAEDQLKGAVSNLAAILRLTYHEDMPDHLADAIRDVIRVR